MAENVRSSSSSSSRKPRNNIISSILLSSSPTNDKPSSSSRKNNNFTSATFRGLGCTASSSSQVSPPSANNKLNKKKKKLKTKKTTTIDDSANPSSSCVGVPDVWCAPGIALATDATSVDCRVVSRRPARDEISNLAHRERPYTVRRMVTPEDIPFLVSDTALGMPRLRSDGYGSRHHRHVRHGFQDGLAEIVMLQRGRSDGLDRYRDLRLDVDNMSYEELVQLGEKIGFVSTGLKEDEIACCLRRSKLAMSHDLSSHFVSEIERKCSICQEEYEAEDETGKLDCGHFYHIDCIKQWLGQKNICPICKTAAVSQI